MSIFRRLVLFVCSVGFVAGFATSAQAEGWNPLSIFKKKAAPAYQPVIPASAELPIPQLNLPSLPQIPGKLPGVNTQGIPALPNLKLPSFGQQGAIANPIGMIEKWNNGTKNSLDKVKQALTLPKLKLPSLAGGQFTPPSVQTDNPFLKPLTNKLPFGLGNQAPAAKKSLIPQWLTGRPTTQQPPTLNNWLNQARPK